MSDIDAELVVKRWNGRGFSSVIVPGNDALAVQRAHRISVLLAEQTGIRQVAGPSATGDGFQVSAYGTHRACSRAFTAACPLDRLRFVDGHARP